MKAQNKPAGVFVPEPVEEAAVRKKQKLSQKNFAKKYGLHLGTLRDWEQGRRTPDRAVQVLLAVIDRNPQAVTAALEVDTSGVENNRIGQQNTILA